MYMCDNNVTRWEVWALLPLSLCRPATFHIVNIINHEHDGTSAQKQADTLWQTEQGAMNGSKDTHFCVANNLGSKKFSASVNVSQAVLQKPYNI